MGKVAPGRSQPGALTGQAHGDRLTRQGECRGKGVRGGVCAPARTPHPPAEALLPGMHLYSPGVHTTLASQPEG